MRFFYLSRRSLQHSLECRVVGLMGKNQRAPDTRVHIRIMCECVMLYVSRVQSKSQYSIGYSEKGPFVAGYLRPTSRQQLSEQTLQKKNKIIIITIRQDNKTRVNSLPFFLLLLYSYFFTVDCKLSCRSVRFAIF